MEREPFRFVGRAAPGLNAALVAMVLLAGFPALWIALDIVQAVIDDVIAGRAFAEGQATGSFLRYALELPERIREEPVVFARGLELSREALVTASIAGLAVVAVVLGIVGWGVERLRARIGVRVAATLLDRILDAIASAPAVAGEEARHAALLAGNALAGRRRVLGLAAATPVLTAAGLALALFYVARTDLRMALALLLGLTAFAAGAARSAAATDRIEAADAVAGTALRRRLTELARHLAALAAHGTGASERARLGAELAPLRGPAEQAETRAAAASGGTLAAALVGPLATLAVAAYAGSAGSISPGEAGASTLAACFAVAALAVHLWWRRALADLRPVFGEIARTLGTLQSRRRARTGAPLPPSGPLVLENVSTGSFAGERLVGADLSLTLPVHAVLTGGAGSGARAFAALLGGQVPITAGHAALGRVDLAEADPENRAQRLAFAGGDTYLLPGSLRLNLLYGCRDPDAADIEARLTEAVNVAGLDAVVEGRGLAGSVDPRRQPELAERIVAARRAIRTALADSGGEVLVEPFDRERYNPQATIGENILFGVALGDTFREDRLPAQPFVKALLDGEGLTKPLAAMGEAIAQSTAEIFAELPEGSPLVGRFALVPRAERAEIDRVLERRSGRRRGVASGRDAERLIGLALRYSESRHRLGLLGPELRERLVRLRAGFAAKLPASLGPSVEFFDPDHVCAAANVRDNLLFGRIAQDRAGAEGEVFAIVSRVLREVGLADEVRRVGLAARVDPAQPHLSTAEIAAIDLARCLVRRPDTLVVERALDGLAAEAAAALVERLAAAQTGRGLLVVAPAISEDEVAATLPERFAFAAGRPAVPARAHPVESPERVAV